jgi:hypothetical protein
MKQPRAGANRDPSTYEQRFFFEMMEFLQKETHHMPREGICVRGLRSRKLAKPVGVAPISYTGEATSRSQQ